MNLIETERGKGKKKRERAKIDKKRYIKRDRERE